MIESFTRHRGDTMVAGYI